MHMYPSRTVGFGGRRLPALAWLTTLATLVAVSGCGESVETLPPVTAYPVKGKVLLPDGSPLSEGVVTFVPVKEDGRRAVGKLQSDGTFTLTTEKPDDGAAEGDYKVAIDSDLAGTETDRKGRKRALLPAKYRDETSSPLKATVKPEPNDLPPFQLDNKPAEKLESAGGRGGRRRDRDDD